MNRLMVCAWLSLLLAASCLSQQPQNPAPNPSPQSSSSQAPAPQPDHPLSSNPSSSAPDASKPSASKPSASKPSPTDTQDDQESSSNDTRTDTRPPKDDAKEHPNSNSAVGGLESVPVPDSSGVEEFHPWNPMKAIKDVEVGDYYFRRKNYKAALDRYKEALYYKENDAVATYRLAVCQQKLGAKAEARKNFEQYLKILPEGPFAKDARASLEKLSTKENRSR